MELLRIRRGHRASGRVDPGPHPHRSTVHNCTPVNLSPPLPLPEVSGPGPVGKPLDEKTYFSVNRYATKIKRVSPFPRRERIFEKKSAARRKLPAPYSTTSILFKTSDRRFPSFSESRINRNKSFSAAARPFEPPKTGLRTQRNRYFYTRKTRTSQTEMFQVRLKYEGGEKAWVL